MDLYLKGHSFQFECENLCRLFFPYSPVHRIEADIQENKNEPAAFISCEQLNYSENTERFRYTVVVMSKEKCLEQSEEHAILDEYLLTKLVFNIFSEFTDYTPKWGMLTGIHPAKVLWRFCSELGEESGIQKFREEFFVSEEKTELAKWIMSEQRDTLSALTEDDFSLYIGIPFCPTRCSYCSFVSQDIEQSKKLIEPYFELLLKEIEKTAEVAKKLSLRLISVYVGGGTPTTLSASQIKSLCEKVYESFDMSSCREFTVEAGRPDTITPEKLEAMKNANVSRISINPQSLSDNVLKAIGRNHSSDDVRDAFKLAKDAGFTSINADLIVGLPEDNLDGFKKTINEIIELGASNITVHALAIKRSSAMNTEKDSLKSHKDAIQASQMMSYAEKRLTEAGFSPYYLYRQTRMAGNLENVGWAKDGDICRYNIYTMDESSTVIACGAGGVSKIVGNYGKKLERIFNFKFPYEYIDRFDEILNRKDGVIEVYEQFCERIY